MEDILEEARKALWRRDFPTAAALARSYCGACPDVADGWFCLGVALQQSGLDGEALPALEECFARRPEDPNVASALAVSLHRLGRTADAVRRLDAWIERRGDHPRVRLNRAVLHEALGDVDAALRDFTDGVDNYSAPLALRLEAGRGATVLCLRRGAFAQALVHARATVALDPDDAAAQFNLAEVALANDRPEEALTAAAAVLALDPAHTAAAIDRGVALAWLGEFADAEAVLTAARTRDPDGAMQWTPNGDAALRGAVETDARLWFAAWHERLVMSGQVARREAMRAGYARIAAAAGSARDATVDLTGLPHRALAAGVDAAAQLAIARLASAGVAARVATAASGGASKGEQSPFPPVARDGRLRIGYVCADWREHPTARLLWRHFAAHDRSRFAVFGYHLFPGPDDACTARVAAGIETFRRVGALDDANVADVIRDDALDVIVDLGGWLADARPGVLARRPAPRQVAWLAYPGTTGAPWIDAALVDAVACPDGADAHWSERLVRLPRTMLTGDPDALDRAHVPSRAALGFAPDAVVLAAFHVAWKIDARVLAAWAAVLHAVPAAVLWLVDPPRGHLDALVDHGVSRDRLHVAARCGHAEHLARLAVADLALDPWVCAGHTTAFEALAAGVPLIARTGDTFATRVATSLLHAVGLPCLAASSDAAYVDTAIALARDGSRRAELRQSLRDTVPEVFSPTRHCREVEAALTRLATAPFAR